MRLLTLESRFFLGLVLLTTGAFLWIVWEFLMPVFWAIVLAILFRPVFRRWLRLVRGRPSAAALLTTLTVILVILVPFALLVTEVTRQALGLYRRIASGEVNLHAPIDFIERSTPAVTDLLASYGIKIDGLRTSIENAAVAASQYIATQALAIGQDMLTFTIFFALMLYFLFFFVRDWERILAGIVRALPLGDERERRLFAKFAEVTRATMKGTLVVAAVQGTIGGVLFAIVGMEAALFWGVAMAVFSFLPVIGAALIWGPAALFLLATGSIWEGIVLIAGGTLVIGLADNVLRPILVGHETKMPDYLVLLSTLGGLTVFGISGIVIGPLVAALFLVVWEMMAEERTSLPTE
ncbi:MAG: AI-2E family transporter [Bacteroidetes bacterium]|jgi:predicted PurR-regulated permease PerM|nr:AI-2E family transporter [Bacteroidota bacterium]